MKNRTVPWTDAAVLVRDFGMGDRRIIGSGTLEDIVSQIRHHRSEWERLMISLPDRRIEPFVYTPDDFLDLIFHL